MYVVIEENELSTIVAKLIKAKFDIEPEQMEIKFYDNDGVETDVETRVTINKK